MKYKYNRGRVWIETNPQGNIVRIFRNQYAATTSKAWGTGLVVEYPRKDAVVAIRKAVFDRANNNCEKCGEFITWGTFHLNEKIPRSKGGEVSLENSEALCAKCHIGIFGQHGNRRPQLQFIRYKS